MAVLLIARREVRLQLGHAHEIKHIRTITFEDSRRTSVVAQDGLEPAMRKAERACELVPDRRNYLHVLGGLQFRVGRYADALTTLDRADLLPDPASPTEQAVNAGLRTMSLWQLDRKPEARQTMQQLETLFEQEEAASDPDVRKLVDEARQLLRVERAPSEPKPQ